MKNLSKWVVLFIAITVFTGGCGFVKNVDEAEEDGNVTAYSYEGTVNYEGKLQCEEYENPDGSKDVIYNVYDGDELVFGFYEPEEEDFYEFYTGQDGEIHYVRKDHCTEDE